MLSLWLPYPPSSNNNTAVVNGRRISSRQYRAWRAKAERDARILSDGAKIVGPYRITYTAQRPDWRRRDVENLPKSLADALQAAGVIRDDCDCLSSTIAWADGLPVGKGAAVLVEITPA